jgi:hypothetical protein
MRVVTITDREGEGAALGFDLVDILRLLEPELHRTEWTLSGTECIGREADRVHRIDDDGQRVSGTRLLALASGLTQVIDGEFIAYAEDGQPWVTIRAIDSSAYDVISDDGSVTDRIRARFKEVTEMPAEQYFGPPRNQTAP